MAAKRVLVIGAGAAGLASAAELKRRGADVLVVDRGDGAGHSWRRRYDRLRLNTMRGLSDLPGLPMDRRFGRWPTRDAYAGYLERFAAHHGLEPRFGTEAGRVDRCGSSWRAATSEGDLEADMVVVSTGLDNTPTLPEWPGRREFAGCLIHSSDYRNARPFRDQDVLVVGAGNSASDIAVDLLEGGARRVRIAIRTPPHVLPREFLGIPLGLSALVMDRFPTPAFDLAWRLVQRMVYGSLEAHLGRPPLGVKSALEARGVGPMADEGFVKAVKAGEIQVVPEVVDLDATGAVLSDGRRIGVDAVVAATGYRRNLEPLVGHLHVLDGAGSPLVHAPRFHPNAPGMAFVGFTPMISGTLLAIRRQARALGRAFRAAG